jgi:hypothetical protein
MSFLLDKLCSFLPPNIASKYTTSKLQQKLLNYFGNAIIVEKQRGQGKSNTVFSSSITVMGPSKYFGIKYLFSFLHPYSKGDLGGGLAWNATRSMCCINAAYLTEKKKK